MLKEENESEDSPDSSTGMEQATLGQFVPGMTEQEPLELRIGFQKLTYKGGERINLDEIGEAIEAIEEPDVLSRRHEATINALWRWAEERPEDLRQVLKVSRNPEIDMHYLENKPPTNRPVGELIQELRATEKEMYEKLAQVDRRR